MSNFNNVLSYPTMTRQREEKIQANAVAYSEDVNAELNHIQDVYNRLVAMLTGEWGDETGRIYDLIDTATTLANEALTKAENAVKKTGDTMTGQLNTALVPESDYNMVNKKYVDDKINDELAEPVNRIEVLEQFKENLSAEQVKLENVNFTGKTVHDGMTELFLSVSSGKATVAAAITGKGVQTAADDSFKKMADNINAILTFTEGTSGGTATSMDIIKGKTAYARGQLLIGEYIPLDTSDATATSESILAGYTAYVGGGKIIGTYTPRTYPVYGTDTSNATAVSSDIALGKTAYARGQLLIGTANINGDVEEILGAKEGEYNANIMNIGSGDPPDGQPKTVMSKSYAFSKDGRYLVRVGTTENTLDTDNYYIESFPINEDGIYYMASMDSTEGNVSYKKYRYTKKELGLGDTERVEDIKIGAGGFNNDVNVAVLYVLTSDSSIEKTANDYAKLHIYTYHLKENGIIGRMSEGETGTIYNLVVDIGTVGNLVTPNISPSNFLILFSTYNSPNYYTNIRRGELVLSVDKESNAIWVANVSEPVLYIGASNVPTEITSDDRYICNYNDDTVDTSAANVISLDEDYYSTAVGTITGGKTFSITALPTLDKFIHIAKKTITIYNIKNNLGAISFEKEKTVNISLGDLDNEDMSQVGNIIITPDSSKLITNFAYIKTNTLNNFMVGVFNLVDIINAEDSDTVQPIQTYVVPSVSTSSFENPYELICNYSGTNIYSINENKPAESVIMTTALDEQNILGIKYKGQFFARLKPQILSAGGGDVVKGKTFIGYQGTVETGTLEV